MVSVQGRIGKTLNFLSIKVAIIIIEDIIVISPPRTTGKEATLCIRQACRGISRPTSLLQTAHVLVAAVFGHPGEMGTFRAVTMGVPVGRFPGGAGQKRVPKGKKGAVRRLFF